VTPARKFPVKVEDLKFESGPAFEPTDLPPLEPAMIVREKIQPSKAPTLRLILGGKKGKP